MHSGLAIVAASPQLTVGVGGGNSQDVAVVHGGGVVLGCVSVDTLVASRGHKEGSMGLSRVNSFLQNNPRTFSALDWPSFVLIMAKKTGKSRVQVQDVQCRRVTAEWQVLKAVVSGLVSKISLFANESENGTCFRYFEPTQELTMQDSRLQTRSDNILSSRGLCSAV